MRKGQALVNFIIEFTYSDTTEVAGTIGNAKAMEGAETDKGRMSATVNEDNFDNAKQWTLYVNGAFNKNRSGAGMMLISPEGNKIHCALRFGFQPSKNKAKYEALISGLQLARELRVCYLKVYSDTQLVVN